MAGREGRGRLALWSLGRGPWGGADSNGEQSQEAGSSRKQEWEVEHADHGMRTQEAGGVYLVAARLSSLSVSSSSRDWGCLLGDLGTGRREHVVQLQELSQAEETDLLPLGGLGLENGCLGRV